MFSFILVQGEDSNTQCVWVAKADTIMETRGHKEARRRREARLRDQEEHVVTEAHTEQVPGETEYKSAQRPTSTTTQAIPRLCFVFLTPTFSAWMCRRRTSVHVQNPNVHQ